MKKIALFLIIALPIFSAAQSVAPAVKFTQTVSNPTGAVTTGTIDTMTVDVVNTYNAHGIQWYFAKTSGTAAATSILQSSIDGLHYINTDTVTFGNASLSVILTKTNPVYLHYRVLTTGAGSSMVATVTAAIIGRRLF